MTKHRVLIVDDILDVCQNLQEMLGDDFEVEVSTELRESVKVLQSGEYDLLVSGLVMSEISGFELLREIRRSGNDLPIVMVTSWGNEQCAAEALRLGATKFLCHPVAKEELIKAVSDAIANPHGISGSDFNDFLQLGELVTGDSAMMDLFNLARKVAVTDSRVLIQGATGTGKRLFARAIHSLSNRRTDGFVELNCAAIPETLIESELFGHQKGAFTGATSDWKGRFEEAGLGTLFLDEIGELELGVQSKLLQVLQTGEYLRIGGKGLKQNKSRVIAATNRDLLSEVEAGHFRADLYYRLNVVTLSIPSLVERPRDISLLARMFLKRFQLPGEPERRFSDEAISLLEKYSWPGNVRELENLVERVAVIHSSKIIGVDALPEHIQHPSFQSTDSVPYASQSTKGSYKDPGSPVAVQIQSFKEAKESFEREWLARTIESTSRNMSKAARRAGMDRGQFYRLAKRHGLTKPR